LCPQQIACHSIGYWQYDRQSDFLTENFVATLLENLAYDRRRLETTFLPIGQMLQIDRVFEITNGLLVCEMDIPGHWTFPMHFPNDPIIPGTVLMEAAGQAVGIWAWHAGARGKPRLVKTSAKFESPVVPTDQTVRLTASVRQKKNVFFGRVQVSVLERKVADVEATLIICTARR